ncbi:MAG: hypothetical protein IJG50_04675 [Clostridia bacterium]|nr:hypothetical protein [Clostridia bacterium]
MNVSDVVTNIGWHTFYGCESLPIHAPAGSYAEEYEKKNNITFEAIT